MSRFDIRKTLSNVTVRGSAWIAAGRAIVQISSLVRLIILARFIPPTEFGLMAIALVVLQVMEAFTNPGLDQALIQRKGEIGPFLPTVFWTKLFRGIMLGALVAMMSGVAASFFDIPEATRLIQLSGIIFVIRGLFNPAIALVHRELRFRSIFLIDITSSATGFISALVLLVFTQSVWVLIGALILEELARLVGSYVVQYWKPSFSFSWVDLRSIGQFSRWVTLGTIVSFVSLQLDTIVVGRLLGSHYLGVYQMGMRISQLPATQIGTIGGTIAFPILSKAQDDLPSFRKTYLKITTVLFLLSLLATATIVMLTEPIVMFALGSEWYETIPVIRILALAGFVRGILTIAGRVYYALGRPELDVVLNSVRTVLMLVLIYPMVSSFGVTGAAVTFTISLISVIPIHLIIMRRYADTSFRDHLRILTLRHVFGK